jgi:tRNA threonylcarbamoyladenosine biosynthesis protein TsaB
MTRLLALDTATEACSAALLDGKVLRERFELAPREHARLLLPMVESLLNEANLALADLDAIAFGRGPGSFTGVRIAAGMAQGLAFAAGLPVAPVSSLAALAQGAADAGHSRVLAAIDARMGEVYWGAFVAGEDGLVAMDGIEEVCSPETVPLPEGADWFGAGTGWATYTEVLQGRLGPAVTASDGNRFPQAGAVARLAAADVADGNVLAPEQALPVYLRNQVAQKPG